MVEKKKPVEDAKDVRKVQDKPTISPAKPINDKKETTPKQAAAEQPGKLKPGIPGLAKIVSKPVHIFKDPKPNGVRPPSKGADQGYVMKMYNI